MELTQILSLDQWRAIEDQLFEKYRLQGSVFNTEGIRITDGKNWANKLCPAIKALDKGQSFICAVAHMNMANQAQQTQKTVIEECDAGLLKLVVPIVYNGEYLGVVGGCGLLAEDGEVDSFAINKITDMEEDSVEALSAGIPVLSEKKAAEVCEYLEKQLEEAFAKVDSTSGG